MKVIVTLAFFLVLISLISCSPEARTPLTPEAKPAILQVAMEKWQIEWERVVSQAKKEGTVVIYTTLGSETTTVLRQAFKSRFGVEAEFVGGRGGEVAQKILTERRAGLYLVDIYQGGANTAVLILKPGKVFDPLEPALILPEVTNPNMWYEGKLDFADIERTVFPYLMYTVPPLAYNTTIVKPEDINSYRDLLNPRWKGKMVMQDPSLTGTAINWFGVVSEIIMGMDYMRELAKQEPVITRDRRLQVEWLAHGKYPIAIAPQADILGNFEREGAPIKKHTPVEGSHKSAGSGHIALINRAPHTNAARLYINWLLGQEAQTIHSKVNLLPSARVDVSTEHVDPSNILQPGIKYFQTSKEEFILGDVKRAENAVEIFGPLLR